MLVSRNVFGVRLFGLDHRDVGGLRALHRIVLAADGAKTQVFRASAQHPALPLLWLLGLPGLVRRHASILYFVYSPHLLLAYSPWCVGQGGCLLLLMLVLAVCTVPNPASHADDQIALQGE